MMHEGFPLPQIDWEPTAEFWNGAAAGELRIPRCTSCGRLAWYPLGRCVSCAGESFAWEAVSGRGTLFTWVVLQHAFLPAYKGSLPFVSALVTLEEDERVRLPTRIVEVDPEQLSIQLPVEVCFRPMSFDGVEGEVVAPFFRPSQSSSAKD